MNALILRETEFTPGITFDPANNVFEIKGESRPEDARVFFKPILKWLEDYSMLLYWKKDHQKDKSIFKIDFKMQYFNSTSAKYLLDVFNLLQKIQEQGVKVMVHWYYDEADTDILEAGEEFLSNVNVQHKLIPVK